MREDGVVELVPVLELGDDPADPLVHLVYLCRVSLHAPGLPGFVGSVFPSRYFGIAGAELGSRFHDAELVLAPEAILAQLVPAGVEAALILVDVALRGVERPVRGGVRNVEEEGFVLRRRTAEEADGLVGDGVGVVEIWVLGFMLDVGLAADQRPRFVEAAATCECSIEVVESPPCGPGIVCVEGIGCQVPLARYAGGVAVGGEDLGRGGAVAVQVALVSDGGIVPGEDANTGLVGVQAGQERCPRGAAAGGGVELGELGASGGQLVQVGGIDLATVGSQVGVPEVVSEDEHNVWLFPVSGSVIHSES